jgi:DNA-binding NarL/FixJ family response regulator
LKKRAEGDGSPRANAPRRSGGRSAAIRVVLADDHSVVRAGIRQILETAPDIRVVAEAEDGRQAIEAIGATRPDVAVLDVKMPRATGIEATRWIREHSPSTAVLVLTAFDDDPYVLALLQAGAAGYVLKSADAEQIVRAVRSVHAGRSAVDPEIAGKMLRGLSAGMGAGRPERLTARELEVLVLVARGRTNKAIGSQLAISARTVQGHLAKIFDKLQAESRTEAVMRAVSLGWLPGTLGREPQG